MKKCCAAKKVVKSVHHRGGSFLMVDRFNDFAFVNY